MENRAQSGMSVLAQNSILHRAFYLSRCKNHGFIKEANGVPRR